MCKCIESIFELLIVVILIGENLIDKVNMSNLEDIGKYVFNLNIICYGVGNVVYVFVFICGIGL